MTFGFLLFLTLACACLAMRAKRVNVGYMVMTAVTAFSNILCILLPGVRTASEARNVLIPAYIMHAWLLFAILILIVLIDRFRHLVIATVISGCICIYQTFLAVSQFFGARIFSFQKRVYFRKAWWVAADAKNAGLFMNPESYRLLIYLNFIIIYIVLLICIGRSHRIFKNRYYSLLGMVIMYSILEDLTGTFLLPIWMNVFMYDVMTVICLHFVVSYDDRTLREWSLDSFANDMSDGLVLYDRNDDLIHINDMIRNTLDPKLVEGFKDRKNLDEWLNNKAGTTDEKGIISYRSGSRDYYFKVDIRKLGENSSIIGTLYIIHDATDAMVRINAMRKANEELERASRMKSDFLANMSHEIRTPMNAVIGMADIGMREKDIDRVHDNLTQIQSAGRNLLGIINDILDYSKIESGKMELMEDDYVPFSEYLDIANVLGTRIEDKGLELFVLIETKLPHILRGDAMRIRQVIINLANNAIKFTQKGLVRIHIRCEKTEEGMIDLSFHIIDTGIGIKKEDMDRLFVSFQQLDSRRNRSVEGTGLGLAISKRLVEAMGGKIGVNSEYGKGSDFWFTIPQKVVDETNDLRIENAEDKHAFIVYADTLVQNIFVREMGELGLVGEALDSPDEYRPTGKKDYLFFLLDRYDEKIRGTLLEHEKLTGVILIPQSSDFVPDLMNLQILRRPETTMHIVNILNDRYNQARAGAIEKEFKIDFTAPQAEILAVDDNEVNLTIIEGILAPLNMHIDRAFGGEEAIDKALKKDYDIIFMDHMMPGTDGVDATKAIREAAGDRPRPAIIAVSANVMEEARRLFAEAGMDDFVAKPIDVRELVLSVRRWLPADKIMEQKECDRDTFAPSDTQPRTDIRAAGLDTGTAIGVLGSEVLYDRIVEEYCRCGEDKLKEIRDAYEREDWKDYTIKVHSLKSGSRQIGAMELGDMAEALEKAGDAGDTDTIRMGTDRALKAYEALLYELSAFFPDTNGQDDKPPVSRDELRDLMDELHKACEDLDIDAMERVGDKLRARSYDGNTEGLIDGILKAIGDIDTERCESLIADVRGETGT